MAKKNKKINLKNNRTEKLCFNVLLFTPPHSLLTLASRWPINPYLPPEGGLTPAGVHLGAAAHNG